MAEFAVTHRLRVFRSRNWKGQPGYAWSCAEPAAVKVHRSRKPISGFSRDETFTGTWDCNYPSSLSRAMDGARRHLIKYHRLEGT